MKNHVQQFQSKPSAPSYISFRQFVLLVIFSLLHLIAAVPLYYRVCFIDGYGHGRLFR